MIRVTMVVQSFAPIVGGAELQLERLLPYLAERGVAVTVLTRGHPARPRRETIAGGVVRRSKLAGRSPVASIGFLASALGDLVRRRRRVDVVHAHGALSEGTIALGANLLGLPTVVMVLTSGYGGDLERLRLKPLGRLRLASLVRRASFIALSVESRDELLRHGADPAHIFQIPYGVETGIYRPADEAERDALRAELDLPREPVAVYVGRLAHQKRVATVVEAVAGVPGLFLAVVGGGEERGVLERLAHDRGVDQRVRFVGFSDRVRDYLRAADVFVLPSRAEGMSNALLEAMACALACVATPVSGSTELLRNGRGVLVDGEDVAGWTRTLGELARDQGLRARLGSAASAHVRAEFSIELQADRLVALYRTLARRSQPSR